MELCFNISDDNLPDFWINAGGGVRRQGSPMGCGLNVLSFLGYIERRDLLGEIDDQIAHRPHGLMITEMINRITAGIAPPTVRIYRHFFDFRNDRDNNITLALAYIRNEITKPSAYTQRYRFAIIKLVIDVGSGLGHSMIVGYDTVAQAVITFDPQLSTPDRTTIRNFDVFFDYLSPRQGTYLGLSIIVKEPIPQDIPTQPHTGGHKYSKLSESNGEFIWNFLTEGEDISRSIKSSKYSKSYSKKSSKYSKSYSKKSSKYSKKSSKKSLKNLSVSLKKLSKAEKNIIRWYSSTKSSPF